MVIIEATYGNKNVTDILNNMIINNEISFIVENNIFGGDPLPNIRKYLTVKYEYDNTIYVDNFLEQEKCILPNLNNEYKPDEKLKNVKFIIPLPDSKYYLWQILVQINNFRKIGYEMDTHFLVCYFDKPSQTLISLSNSINIKSKFHLYNDTRTEKIYSASMKPWLMSQYFKEFPEEKENVYIYLDPDIIFLKPLNIDKYINDDIWYESNTCSYLDSKYIKSKGEQLFYDMCNIVGISSDIVIENDKNAGGAQYITKNNTYEYWDEVSKTSHPLYKHMVDTAHIYKPENDYSIQAWTSEMWTTNWCLWKRNIKTKCIPELEFHWANHEMKNLRYSIYHNAGIVNNDGIHFSKTTYQNSPFNQELNGDVESLSYLYIEEIKDTEMNFPELIECF